MTFASNTQFRKRPSLNPQPGSGLGLVLSEGQKKVASLPTDSVVSVFGAPASGKTTALKALLRRCLEPNAAGSVELQPGQAIVLTASRTSANQLRDDLAIELQLATPGPLARTLASFAFGVLRHSAIAEGGRLPELISGSEQDRILNHVIAEALAAGAADSWPKHISEVVLGLNGFRAELRDLITVCLEHGLSPSDLRRQGAAFEKLEWVAAADLFEDYLRVLSGPSFENRHDASSLLVAAASWLSANADWPAVLADLKLLLVDDAQELTPAANRLLRAIASRGCGLVVFGDPDVSTLGFRAADPRSMSELIESISSEHGKTAAPAPIFLEANPSARTPQIAAVMAKVSSLIDTAKAGRQRRQAPVSLEENETESASLEGLVFKNPTAETSWLARRLRELHLYEGVAFKDMAIVARSNQALQQLELSLSSEAVPAAVIGSQSALRDEYASRALLRTLERVLSDQPVDLQGALEMLGSPLCGLDNLGLRRLRRALRREELAAEGNRNSDELLVALFEAAGSLATVSLAEGRRANRFLKSFFAAKVVAATATIEELLWQLWNPSGLAKEWHTLSLATSEVSVQANRNLDAVVGLFAAANRYVERNPAGSAHEFVAQQLNLGLPEDSLAFNDSNRDTVQLLTPAGLIGKRFRVVAIPQLIEGVWPNLRPRSSLLGSTTLDAILKKRIENPKELNRSELPDELRMLLKAVGAASERLLISAAESEDSQISQFLNLMLGGIPDPIEYRGFQLTLRGLAGQLRRRLAAENTNPNSTEAASLAERESIAMALARLAEAQVAGAHPDSWYGLAPLSTEEPLFDFAAPEVTPEGVELKLPIYPSQLESFVKCPLHWFLNSHGGSDSTFSANLGTLVHKALELGETPDEESLWRQVESKWHTLSFESEWLEAAGQRKAKKMISNMVQYLRSFQASAGRVVAREANFEFEFGKTRVRGQVDRIELHPDGRVMIVDLKTGNKAYSNEEAQQNAQLGLYQLAFENGAFDSIFENAELAIEDLQLGGAKLLLVSGDKPTEKNQTSIGSNPESKAYFEALINDAAEGMAMTDRLFIARVDTHCNNENEFGTCQLHLTKAVSYVG